MAMSTLQDNEALSAAYKDALSPITNYSNGLLQLALMKRQEEKQQQSSAAERAFQLQRDQSQSALVLAREKQMEGLRNQNESARAKQQAKITDRLNEAASTRAKAMLQLQWDHADKERKKEILDNLKTQAERRDIPLPDSKAPLDDQASQLNRAIGKANAGQVMDLIESGKKLNRTFSQLTGATDAERAKYATQLLLSDPAAKVLTADETKRINLDPSQVFGVLARLKEDKSTKGQKAAEAFREAMASTDAAATSFYAQHSKNPEAIAQIRGDMDLQRIALHAALSEKDLPPGTYAHMFDGVIDEAQKIKSSQQQQQATGTPPPLPSPAYAARMSGQPLPGTTSPATTSPGTTSPGTTSPGTTSPGTTPSASGTGGIPAPVLRDPYGALMSIVRQEQQSRPPGGSVLSGSSPFAVSPGSTPVSDEWFSRLGSAVGLTNQPIGSSVFSRSPGSQLQQGLSNPALISKLDAIPPQQRNQLAGSIINQIFANPNPNDPARLRLMKWANDSAGVQNTSAYLDFITRRANRSWQDRAAATQGAIAPTAFPGVAGLDPEATGF